MRLGEQTNYARDLGGNLSLSSEYPALTFTFGSFFQNWSGSPTRHSVFNTVHHRRLAGCSTESVQSSTVAKRRFWLRESST